MNRRRHLLLATVSLFLIALGNEPSMLVVAADNIHLTMGNPSKAGKSDDNNYLLEKEYFALSYNRSKGTPNWVSWHLGEEDLGDAPRFPFKPDLDLPDKFGRITTKVYVGGGFDRGHMCPHSDRTATVESSKATFVMTNIIPQSAQVNQKAWAQFETYCRHLVTDEGKELYIVSGPYGKGGRGRNGFRSRIGEGKVVVPAHCWKVVMVLDAMKGDDVARVNDETRLIAVIMPNDTTVGEDWARFRVPVKAVEELTGFVLFDKISPSIIGPLKETVDSEEVETPSPIIHARRRPRSRNE